MLKVLSQKNLKLLLSQKYYLTKTFKLVLKETSNHLLKVFFHKNFKTCAKSTISDLFQTSIQVLKVFSHPPTLAINMLNMFSHPHVKGKSCAKRRLILRLAFRLSIMILILAIFNDGFDIW